MRALLLLIFTAITLATQAQTSVYHPFPDSDAVWCCSWGGTDGSSGCYFGQLHFQLNGHAIINGRTYNRLEHVSVTQHVVESPWSYVCDSLVSSETYIDTTTYYIRQDTVKKIWIYNTSTNADSTFYDFNLKIGDTLDGRKVYWNELGGNNYRITSIDSMLVNGNYRKRYNYSTGGYFLSTDTSMVEGIGSLHGLTMRPSGFENWTRLDKFIQENHVLYGDTNNMYCPSILLDVNENIYKKLSTLFPNPFHSTATLTTNVGKAQLKIYNTLGLLVQEEIIPAPSTTIYRNSLSTGIYFYQLVSENGQVASGKFVIE